jgi:hypothetical protein
MEYDPVIVRQLEALLLSGNPAGALATSLVPLRPEESEWLKNWAVNSA